MKQKRVTFIIKTLALHGGGAERVLSHVMFELVTRGWQVEVMSFDTTDATSFYPLDSRILWTRLGKASSLPGAGGKAAAILHRAYLLRRRLRTTKSCAVVTFMSSSSVPAALALAGTSVPLVVSEHIVVDYYWTRRIELALLGFAFRQARAITMISERMKEGFCAQWPNLPYHVVPNPIECTVQPADLNYAAQPSKRILAAGTLEERKNFSTLIKAFSTLKPDYPDWRLTIFGEGPLRTQLEALVARLGLQEEVSLPGSTSSLLEEMQKCDIFAMPSTLESFGMVTLEAMSVGVPAVGLADCPGTNDVIEHETTGLLVQGEDLVPNFASALKRLIDDRPLREQLGRAALDYAATYDRSKIGEQWHQMLLGVQMSSAHQTPKVG